MAKRRPLGALSLVALGALTCSMVPGGVVAASASRVTLTAVSGNATGLFAAIGDLTPRGYEQSEVFISGVASAYAPMAPLTADGRWSVAPTAPQRFTTRAVVYRPIDPKRFKGTVLVEWLNVSAFESGPDWIAAHNQLIRDGYAWVGVSAQAAGMNAARAANPGRYGSLDHPGDSYSYDIFSQAGQAVRDQATTLLDGLQPKAVIAVGESQSAIRLTTYLNAVQPLAHVFDGFLVHSRFRGGAPLTQSPLPEVPVPSPTVTRDDLDVPVFVVQMETDVAFGSFDARQPDTDRYRLWEVAGTAHADTYTTGISFSDTGDGRGAVAMFQSMRTPPVQAAIYTCATPINTGPQHWVVQAAIFRLDRWVRKGTPPPVASRLGVVSTSPFTYALDTNGNVQGGVRTPHVDAPIARLSGLGQSGSGFCALFGTTVPFSFATLIARYPTHAKFAKAWRQATSRSVRAGFLLPADGRELKAAGGASTVPN